MHNHFSQIKTPILIRLTRSIFAVLASLALAGPVKAAGPTSTLYLTAGDDHHNWRVLPGTTTGIASTQFETASQGEYAIAVSDGTIRTGGNGQFGAPRLGSTYDLNFNYLGLRLANPLNNILDGTTDGTFNYGINYLTRAVYRCNLDWSSPTLIFTASAVAGNSLGISYDSKAHTLWIGDANGAIDDYSLAGTLLSSFNTPGSGNLALAYDGADSTLWAMTDFYTGIFRQYTTTGALLQTIDISCANNIIGGEFALTPVPEPGILSLAALGLLTLTCRKLAKRNP